MGACSGGEGGAGGFIGGPGNYDAGLGEAARVTQSEGDEAGPDAIPQVNADSYPNTTKRYNGAGGLSDLASSTEDLLAMMNRRVGVRAEFAAGDAEAYLRAVDAEGSHMLDESGQSSILLRRDVATRWTAFHEWLHVVLQRRNGAYIPGEDQFIERFLARHSKILVLGQ